MNKRLIRKAEVKRLTGYCDSSIYEKMAKGTFPKTVRLGPKSVAWVESEIIDHVNGLIAERDGISA